jgi:uncharacterized protein HemY
LEPKQGAYWNTLGVAQYRMGEWDAAVTALEKSMELGSGHDSFNLFFLAMAHWHLGQKEKALDWYRQAVEWMNVHSPKDEELLRFRVEAEELLGVKDKQE